MATYPFSSALVTGASSGIGEELTRQLAAAGVTVVVVARRVDRLEALAGELDGIEVLAADLGTRAGQDLVAARIADAADPIDLVVNNAGFGTTGTFHELDVDRQSDEIELNVGALTRLTHAALAAMVPRKRGWVLNVSSFASFQPGAAARRLRGDQGVRHESQREPPRGGQVGGCRRHRAVPRPDPYRVPRGQPDGGVRQ